jgi:hypothetical protein
MSCSIGNVEFERALCDLSANVNHMSFIYFQKPRIM